MNELMQVKFNEEVVITTKMLAEVYGCDTNNISVNFKANKDKFIEGKHYYKVEGEELKNLRMSFPHLQISPKTRTLYLWTKRGASRHCKMLGTDKAWDMFDVLEENYFNSQAQLTTKLDSYMIEDPIARAKRWIEEQEEKQLLEHKVEEMQPRIDYLDKIQGYGVKITTSQIAVDYGMSATAFNKLLKELHIQYKQGGVWYLYQNYKGKGYEVMSTYNGHLTRYWTPQGAEWLYHILKENGYVPVVETELKLK